MQFDMIHCHAAASLGMPGFVVASIVWAGVIAYVWQLGRSKDRSMWKVVAFCALISPLAAPFLATLLMLPEPSYCTLTGRWLWLALPLAIPFVALQRQQPRVIYASVAARAAVLLTCLHAWWTVRLFRDELYWDTSSDRVATLEANVAPAPWVAFLGAAAMSLVYVAVERRAQPGSWRQWIAARLQLLVAVLALVFEVRYASASTIFEAKPEALMITPVIALVAACVVQGILRARRLELQTSTPAA